MSYQNAIEGLDLTVIEQAYVGDYQGDWFAVLFDGSFMAKDKTYGFLVVGYGSCSGCDAWQACYTAEERLQELSQIVGNIKWFSNLQDLKDYVASQERGTQWYYHADEYAAFQKSVAALDTSKNYW